MLFLTPIRGGVSPHSSTPRAVLWSSFVSHKFAGLQPRKRLELLPQALAVFGDQNRKRMPPLVAFRPIFYRSKSPGASAFVISRHPRASVSQNVGVEGHPFSQIGHPLFQNTSFGGHQLQPVILFKIKKGQPNNTHVSLPTPKQGWPNDNYRILQSPLPWL